ncbi:hypothetical protein L596_021898 [Steinernema carpocapsae]|uniref:J domain-containing protein n=1 Tax=Steinernema carpocapsae TaxID=34508 RepID=A0A4U5MKY9_STECR|nr:hypothetical protein L596_021898 [Steinernema carpocapsae]
MLARRLFSPLVTSGRTFRFHRSPFQTHYTVLKVHSEFSDEEVKQAYNAAIERIKANAAAEISALNLAFNAVNNEHKREEYNLLLADRHEGYFKNYLNESENKENQEIREFVEKAVHTERGFEFELTIHRDEYDHLANYFEVLNIKYDKNVTWNMEVCLDTNFAEVTGKVEPRWVPHVCQA